MASANETQVGGSHYKTKIEHWDYVLANEIPYLEAQIIKYLTRWRKKNGEEDVKKAFHFFQKLVESEGFNWRANMAEAPAGLLRGTGGGSGAVAGPEISPASSIASEFKAQLDPRKEYCSCLTPGIRKCPIHGM